MSERDKKMNKDVIVDIKGKHDNGNNEEIHLSGNGSYHMEHGVHFVKFEHTFEGSDKPTRNFLKIDGNRVELKRFGTGASHMIFEKGNVNYTHYQTALGVLDTGFDTKEIQIEEEDDKIVVKIRYHIVMDGEKISASDIEIKISNH